jgi:hypothetical protein
MSILNFKKQEINKTYLTVSVLGKSLKLNVKYTNNSIINLDKKENEIDLFLPKNYKNSKNIDIINLAIQKLYSKIAITEIEDSMEIVRHILKFAPEDYKIERLNNAFYKCKNGIITINPDIVQFNKEIINTTIFQAFCKIKFKLNSTNYKKALQNGLLKYEEYKITQSITEKIKISA